MELKLKLKAGAIPTIFPETEAYKASKKAPLNPNDLGPGKHNRANVDEASLHFHFGYYVDELMAELLRMKEEYKSDANARAASVFICKQNPEVRGCAEPSFAI
ncbi:hypothetical protein DPMN_149072 [Dreissena polymorpha]|uniref:Uncharacterized protein n=1 Tax=Dreissena polymorpha TaxID=45954 RepID=A0A9D4J4Z3_DREPO|nr:hypothetical protein DPMN_149072 [Dreissena polymorpha]